MVEELGCEMGKWPLKYLGLPPGGGRGDSRDTFLRSGVGKSDEVKI